MDLILTFLNSGKFIKFLLLFFVLVTNPCFAEFLMTKSEIFRRSNKCFKDFEYRVCNNLILEMEKIQLVESDQNRYKCQSSILGLQTEIAEAYSFKKIKKSKSLVMIPYVIKNCKHLK